MFEAGSKSILPAYRGEMVARVIKRRSIKLVGIVESCDKGLVTMYQPPFCVYGRRCFFFWSVNILLLASISSCGADYDTVIQGGRVIDPESGLDSVLNVGIREGQVSAISGGALDGSEVIDATG